MFALTAFAEHILNAAHNYERTPDNGAPVSNGTKCREGGGSGGWEYALAYASKTRQAQRGNPPHVYIHECVRRSKPVGMDLGASARTWANDLRVHARIWEIDLILKMPAGGARSFTTTGFLLNCCDGYESFREVVRGMNAVGLNFGYGDFRGDVG